jgi:F-type H+-transporting ATPase subunit delta
MKLLVEKEHFDSFLLCAEWFHQRFNDDSGIVEARVTSAVALTENELAALRVKLAHISGRQVKLITAVDPSLIGGVRVEMDGRRYDNTIQDRLGRLRRSLTQAL